MRSGNRITVAALSAVGVLCLILDSQTALAGAAEGVYLCLRSVIPSLFPFIVLSSMLTGALSGTKLSVIRPLGKLCKMPQGSEHLLVLGLLGGYPVGAQCIYKAYKEGLIDKVVAQRMLGFCNNAGPAFIFGMTARLFSSAASPWLLWSIHIIASLVVGMLLPGRSDVSVHKNKDQMPSLPEAVSQGVVIITNICGWVILFRVLIGFFRRWFLWFLPQSVQVTLIGLMELINGCNALINIQSQGLRFMLCAAFLGFGGLCVAMQTVSVTAGLGTGQYFPGKILQLLLSLFLSYYVQLICFAPGDKVVIGWFPVIILLLFCTIIGVLWSISKKTVDFPKKLLYTE